LRIAQSCALALPSAFPPQCLSTTPAVNKPKVLITSADMTEEGVRMGLHVSHVLFNCAAAAAGAIAYSTFVVLLCRCIAVGNRKDGLRLELFHQLASFHQAASDQTGQTPSDCPALSEILASVASTGIVKPGMELVVTNSPHSPLVLEITAASNCNGESTHLVAYHYRFVENRCFRETEMEFEVRHEGNGFSLIATRYLPGDQLCLKAFAMLWSDQLMEKGYVDSVKSRFLIAKAA
jgi:hypothetical protein